MLRRIRKRGNPRWFGKYKLSRKKIDPFVHAYRTELLTLDVGAKVAPYISWFPNRIGIDIVPGGRVGVVGDVCRLPFPSNVFGCVLCTEVLEHLLTPQAAIDEFHRVLRPGGMLVLTTRCVWPVHDAPHDYFRFTRYGLAHLARRFEIVELREDGTLLESLAMVVQRLGYQTELLGSRRGAMVMHLVARMLPWFSWIVTKQYGQSPRMREESNIFPAGYLLACRKAN